MKKRLALLIFLGIVLTGCTLPFTDTPTPLFAPTPEPAMTPEPAIPTDEPDPVAPGLDAPQTQATQTVVAAFTQTAPPTPIPPTVTQSAAGPVIQPGTPSGPYAVILVQSGDVLNIRSGPGLSNPVLASFAASAVDVMRNGPSAVVDKSICQNRDGLAHLTGGGGIRWRAAVCL